MMSEVVMMIGYLFVCFIFFFKQKTAYELRISDWSSDVCSSDLPRDILAQQRIGDAGQRDGRENRADGAARDFEDREHQPRRQHDVERGGGRQVVHDLEIGRASCRERVCQYV